MKKSKIIFRKSLPTLDRQNTFLIYDKVLLRSHNFRKWQKIYPYQYAVRAGEELKDLKNFADHMKRILEKTAKMNSSRLQFVVVGGGSVGDFGGFIASTFKRGRRLIMVPSTWLAAIDSSHGGKTALNVDRFKNQIGTFYPAYEIYIIEELLKSSNANDAYGELLKIALIDGGSWIKSISPTDTLKSLRPAIRAKYKIVARDPYESKGLRQILNLGHTWGHVIESAQKIPHGLAVLQGLEFCNEWSHHSRKISVKTYLQIKNLIGPISKKPIANSLAQKYLLQDKKRESRNELRYIFLKDFGKVSRENVTSAQILKEARRQGWIKG